ncbi:nuclear matrix constituent protein 1b-like [Nicotiana tomentosiformis]|uniref:nuclear matrix constituent protein 1b-like n=1 Tax=Nicotiana tomentosiformis TaxID=4098 RepID=UPI00388C88C3
MIREARALKTLSVEGGHRREDPFHDYFTGVEDATRMSDLEVSRKDSGEASGLFNEVQRALNRASVLHREECSRSRAELSRYEADLRRLTEERNALRLRCEQREEEIKDLRAELTKAHQDQTYLIEQVMKILKTHGLDSGSEANISISQLQQKLEMIEQLREEVDIIKAETLGWKESMDRLAADKEVVRAQLSLAESQLQGMKERSSVQARKIEELEARLTFELAKAKSEAEKAKAEADAFVAVYRADAETAQVQARKASETSQTRAYWVVELAKCQSRRETLEEIHARGFDLTEEIKKAKELEAEAGALASDDDDDDESKSRSESGEELDGEEASPGDNQEP